MKVLRYKRKATAALAAFCVLNASAAALARDAHLVNPPVAGSADPLTVRKAFKLDKDPLVSMVLRNEPVESVLRGLAHKANLNLIFMTGNGSSGGTAAAPAAAAPADDPLMALDQEINGGSSAPSSTSTGSASGSSMVIPFLELKDIPVSEAFAIVMQIAGLTGKRVYNSILIATPERMTQLGFASPIIKTYTLYNQIPAQILKAESGFQGGAAAAAAAGSSSSGGAAPSPVAKQLETIFSSRGINPKPQMMLDMRTSTLTVIGTQEAIDIADQMIPILDKQLPQVSVEIKMIELTQRASKELGVTYGFGQGKVGASFNNTDGGNLGPGNPISGDGENIINFSALDRFAPNFNARLNALIRDSEARVLTNPRLTIQHGVTAKFDSTTNFPILSTTTTATAATQTVSSISIGETLEITPFIDENEGIVTMALKPEISTRGELVSVGSQTVPELNKRTVATILRVPNGETVIIGGLMRKSDTDVTSKIPLLGDIPLLGGLFSTTQKSKEDVEIIIMVTPRILQDK